MILSWPFGDVHHAEIFSMSTSIIDVDVKYIWHCTLYPLLKVMVADMTCVTILKGWRRSKKGPRASECPLFEAILGPGGAKWGPQEFSGWGFYDPHTENWSPKERLGTKGLRTMERRVRSWETFGDKGSRVGSQQLRATIEGHGGNYVWVLIFHKLAFWLTDYLVNRDLCPRIIFFYRIRGFAHGHLFHSMNEFIRNMMCLTWLARIKEECS